VGIDGQGVPHGAPIVSGGWQIATRFAATAAPSASRRFYAVYEGGAFGHPERGIIAAMARGHPDSESHVKGAGEAAQLVIHSFAEGYFGARRTLGAKRAAHLALASINAWLYGQTRNDTARHLVPVSLTALMFHGSNIGVVHIGACQVYRSRQGVITPLMRDHMRAAQDGRMEATRAVGLDHELSIDYAEADAEAGDRYLLVSGFGADNQEAVEAAFGLSIDAARSADASAIVLDIIASPRPDAEARRMALADLPLRPAPREGDVWDGFAIGKTLYRGRYTVLKLARDSIENRDVVLKIPLPSMLQDEVFSAGFMREAWIGTTVRGNNVARYIELPDERRSSLYLVMPYYRGETLEARLNRPPLVSLPDGIGIALKLCEAVQDLAAIQIIHRDLKPENIMLLADNEVKLLDLGLAYLPGIDMRDAVKPGGTLRYMAPELLRGVPASARSEVYSLAITIYRMFSAGAYPFGQREAVPLSRLRPDLPRWLGKIIQRAMTAEPSERYADAGEFGRALYEGLVSGMADEAKQASLLQLTKLQIWQAATVVFAVGFFALLIRMLK
jgi:hypothetical protein